MNQQQLHQQQTSIRLKDFQDRESVLTSLQGLGAKGDLVSRVTHEGVEVSGIVHQSLLPSFHVHQYQQREARELFFLQQSNSRNPKTSILNQLQNDMADDERNQQDGGDSDAEEKYNYGSEDEKEMAAKYSLRKNIFLQSQKKHEKDFRSHHHHQQQEPSQFVVEDQAPPPKTLGWLHAIIENFFVFRAKQFEVKQGTALHYALSDESDKASRMIVTAPITDDVAFHIFEMVSERYGVSNVVAQQCDVILRTAKYFSTRDVSACLFFALLKTPNFDSNDVRFVVEAKKAMRSSLVSQRGVDGVLRWFIPLRVVPHVIRKSCDHPWARPVLAKVHSAFERLFSDQRRVLNSSSSRSIQQQQQPLFTLPVPSKLNLVPPFDQYHPLVGRGPFVDIRGNEQFLGSQPSQLVIGADYLLCILFCNWLDHRENVLTDTAEGKPVRTIVNRRQGRVADGKALTDQDSKTVNRLQLFALDIDDETGEFLEGLLPSSVKRAGITKQKSNEFGGDYDHDQNHGTELNGDEQRDTEGKTTTTTTTTMADLAALAEKYQVGKDFQTKRDQQQQQQYLQNQYARHQYAPPRVLHLYTKQ